jgi:hypothetical protein
MTLCTGHGLRERTFLAPPALPGRLFRDAPGRAVPFSGKSRFFGARFAAPVRTAARLDPDC